MNCFRTILVHSKYKFVQCHVLLVFQRTRDPLVIAGFLVTHINCFQGDVVIKDTFACC